MNLRASLDAKDYVDPAVYSTEVEQVLFSSWLPVCRAEQLPNSGDRFAVSLCGKGSCWGGSISRYAFWLQVMPIDATLWKVTAHSADSVRTA